MTDGYIGSFDNDTITAQVCSAGCEASIAELHQTIDSTCGSSASLVPGLPFLDMLDLLWGNWNQSCFVDPTTGENCNDIIAAFPEVEDLADLPEPNLCSYCNVQKLALMQADAYNDEYDEDWQSSYAYVAETCNLTVINLNATESAFNVTVPQTTAKCVSGKTYTTQDGDTCDSIALGYGVSSATMFYINSNIHNCSAIAAGTTLCLPSTCNAVYTVQPGDTCSSIAADNGLLTANIIAFNSMLDASCSNLHNANPSWGSTLCVSTPGGTYTGQAPDSGSTYEQVVVDPPTGSQVAPGTTLDCGAWFVHDASLNLTCAQICLSNQIAINLFTVANPSLNKTSCDTDLVANDAYCVDPLDGWDWASNSTSSTNTTTSTTTAPTAPPAPTQTGIPAACDAYYVAQSGDTCATVAAKFGITEAQFLQWNPAVSSDCTGGFWADEAYCVGVSSSSSTTTTTTTTKSTSSSASSSISTSTTQSVTAPAATQTGIPPNCNKYYVAKSGDTCASVASTYGISASQFHQWNPAVSSDCTSGFWADEAYCVGLAPASAPAPTQSGIPTACSMYYVAKSGDTCATVEALYGISDEDFHGWNPAVSADCTAGFWVDEAYCVGVAE
ncbi:hypothetical protein BDW74DRAFT_186928 [Aspergillus multicolor]|uniref:LysM peptidoglycan-binding domain-containing protein n=1 Tax=Aspergillus multicolor TaxID=41759 RepID=UPI003CCD8D95